MLFLTKNNLFHKLQFGFRKKKKKRSTNHAATALLECICNAFETKELVIGVFIDLSKAFDTIDQAILLDKLYKYGVEAPCITSFTVICTTEHSKWNVVEFFFY